jgi:hypothetical protein
MNRYQKRTKPPAHYDAPGCFLLPIDIIATRPGGTPRAGLAPQKTGHPPHSRPRSRTSQRSTSRCRAGKKASTTFLPNGAAWGPRSPHFNHNMEGSSNHNKSSPVNGGAAAENQLPLHAASPRRMTGAGPHLAPNRRTGIGVMTKPPSRRTGHKCSLARRTTSV